MANGDLDKKSTATNIQIDQGNSYVEQEYLVDGDAALKAKLGSEEKSANIQGSGYYLWNLKKDTLIGGKQNIAEGTIKDATITQEMLKVKIDSLQQLVNNQNVSEANHNYFVLPGQLAKITSSTDVLLVGPYNTIPRQLDETKYSAKTEVYKFYTAQDIRTQIERLKGLMAPTPEEKK